MKIGIISKEDHAKAHARALAGMGHEVVMLGGMPGSIPPSLDVIVCRTASVAHGAYDLAMGAQRSGRKVIFANGVTEITRRVESLEPPGVRKKQEREKGEEQQNSSF